MKDRERERERERERKIRRYQKERGKDAIKTEGKRNKRNPKGRERLIIKEMLEEEEYNK
jgi:hypothetical protein